MQPGSQVIEHHAFERRVLAGVAVFDDLGVQALESVLQLAALLGPSYVAGMLAGVVDIGPEHILVSTLYVFSTERVLQRGGLRLPAQPDLIHLVDDLLGLGLGRGDSTRVVVRCLGELLIAHRSRELRHQLNWDGHLAARALVLEAQTERLLINAGGLKLLHLASTGGVGLEELYDLSAVQVDILQAEITDTTQRPVRSANVVEG